MQVVMKNLQGTALALPADENMHVSHFLIGKSAVFFFATLTDSSHVCAQTLTR